MTSTLSRAPSGSEMASLYTSPEPLQVLESPPSPPSSPPTLHILNSSVHLRLLCKASPQHMCMCVCICVCLFAHPHVGHSPVLQTVMWQTQNPRLSLMVPGKERLSWLERAVTPVIPCFPSITQSVGRMGGPKATGNFPGNEAPRSPLRVRAQTDTEIHPTRSGPQEATTAVSETNTNERALGNSVLGAGESPFTLTFPGEGHGQK